MKYMCYAILLVLVGCDGSPSAPKIAAPQREALERAKGIGQIVQENAEQTRAQAKEAEGY
jgi:hypothetical protein